MTVNNMKRKSFGTLFVSVLVFSCTVKCDECSSSDTSCNATNYTDDNSKASVTEHMSTHIPKPAESLKSMNMLAEDTDNLFRPTVLSYTTSKPEQQSKLTNKIAVSEEPKGRALNFTVDQHTNGNVLSNSSKLVNDFDLSDVSIDNEDEEEIVPRILAPKSATNTTFGVCEKSGLTYENGQTLEIGCDSICTCKNGTMDCVERCKSPFFRSGKKIDDPLCSPKLADDHCCSIMVCAGDTETEPLEICTYNNKTYNRGDTFEKECVESCTCELAGKINCKPRCPQIKQTSDTRCVEVPDPDDFCCMKILCDVTLDENEPDKEDDKTRPQILSAKFVNTTTVLIKFDTKINDNETVDISDDKSTWLSYKVTPEGYVFIKGGGKYLKLENSNEIVDIQNAEAGQTLNNNGCQYKGRSFSLGEEYNDECTSLCICGAKGMNCMKLQCPTYFGVDVLDPNCVEWETIPPDFKPTPPSCCPESVRCKNNGSCEFDGHTFKNWEQLPINVTGCEKRCYCEMGKVECQNVCPPVTALPPPNLECPPNFATVSHIPEDDCCKYWVCNPPQQPNFGGQMFPGFQKPTDDILVHTLEAIDPHTVQLAFMVPRIIVGLHGRVEVRYTHKDDDNDIDSWMLQVFAPPNDLIATPSLEFDLVDLKADTEYRIKITITLRDSQTNSSSRIYRIKTPKEVQVTTLPLSIPIEPDLAITDINATWVTVSWRKFTEYELQFIDGVQLRFKEIDGKIYAATPLIHRAVTSYILENLKPNTKYEIGIDLIPFPEQQTELQAKNMLHFTTANEINNYGFNVSLEVSKVKSQSVEIAWNGVPYPEDKYVNIYRTIYQSDSGKEDQSTFKLAKRDSPTKTVIMDLKPGTRYRIWLEVYLTNGKIKTSNVQDFITKPRLAPPIGTTQQDKLSRAELMEEKGDYYGPLVIVGILAAIAILSTLVLLLILVRRHNQNKAAITPPMSRVNQSAYDNPTYKVEIQQETMGL